MNNRTGNSSKRIQTANSRIKAFGMKILAGMALTLAAFTMLIESSVSAQTLTALYTFSPKATNSPNLYTNRDGIGPTSLVLLSNRFYGSAFNGSFVGRGALYAVNTNGSGFTNLHNFPALNLTLSGIQTNSEGANPNPLILVSNVLYGTTTYGSTNGSGTIFRINPDGTGFTNIYTFTALPMPVFGTNSDGASPASTLLFASNFLYGTTLVGGTTANGIIYKLKPDGSGFTNLHTFAAGVGSFPNVTNSEGANPAAELILSGNTIYGTTVYGGTNGRGAVFRINTDGTGFTNLHTFEGGTGVNYLVTNKGGAHPSGRLCLAGNTLFGRAQFGGSSSYGTIFELNTDGSGFTNLHTFAAGTGAWPNITNTEGANPNFIILSNNLLYGSAIRGGLGGGSFFAINTNGTGFTNLFIFPGVSGPNGVNNGGAGPSGEFMFAGSTIYGAANSGGTNGSGTVFSLTLSSTSSTLPALTMIRSGTNVVLKWPTNLAYTLQFNTNLAFAGGWTNVSTTPVVVSGQYTVTNPISGKQKFFRLNP
jgi:uncharacterized repeat protein (TIGR03803 family)